MTTHSIGPFEFLNMTDPPNIPAEMKTVQKRTGVDHVSIFHTGRRAESSQTRTVSFYPSLPTAWEAYKQFLTLVDSGDAVGVTWAGEVMPYKVQVLEVLRLENQPKVHLLGVSAGAISRARLMCMWRLQVVEEI